MSDAVRLPDLIRRESRSFLQYVREAYPWAKGHDGTARDRLLTMAGDEFEAVAEIARLMLKKHLRVPHLGAFPTDYTSFNYVALPALMPKLIADQRRGIETLDADVPTIDDQELRSRVVALREMKQAHLAEFENLVPTK